MNETNSFPKRVTVATFIVLLMASGFYMLITNGSFFLLVFSGILMGVMFSGMADWLAGITHMKRWVALLLSVIFFFGILTGMFFLLAPTVGRQVAEMQETIPKSIEQLRSWIQDQSWGEQVLEKMPEDLDGALEDKNIGGKISSFFTSTFGTLADLLIVIITALFLASSPELYTHGFTRLFPVRKRRRVLEMLDKCYSTLRMWLLGMLLAMATIGISCAIGYSIIGLPLPFALAFIAFIFAFVPNIGPWLAGIPAVLIGLTVSSQMALYVVLVYGAIQLVESYIITPIIFKKTVALPPALLLFFQVLMGILQGGLGLLMAAPILAIGLVIVKELYVKDFLEANNEAELKTGS